MSLIVVGLSHHSAPVGVRERFVFEPEAAANALQALTAGGAASEAVVLSTCNRTEFYLVEVERGNGGAKAGGRTGNGAVPSADGLPSAPGRPGGGRPARPRRRSAVLRLFADRAGTSPEEASLHSLSPGSAGGPAPVCGDEPDSMILGEAQIQGRSGRAQMPPRWRRSRGSSAGLSRLFQDALAVGAGPSETTLGAVRFRCRRPPSSSPRRSSVRSAAGARSCRARGR